MSQTVGRIVDLPGAENGKTRELMARHGVYLDHELRARIAELEELITPICTAWDALEQATACGDHQAQRALELEAVIRDLVIRERRRPQL